MRVLVIGATGQIGYALAHALAQTAHEIQLLVRTTHGLAFPSNVKIIQHPHFTADVLRSTLAGIDHVIYGVGLPEQFFLDRTLHDRVNLGLLQTFLGELAHAQVRRLTYISTYEVFESRNGVIRESHPVVEDTQQLTNYFKAMVTAFHQVRAFAASHPLELTTIHPAAVYGGRNTGQGFTNYIEDLLHHRVWRVPFIFPGRFPVVHVDSLASAIVRSLDRSGAYLVSDQMTEMKEIALVLKQYANSYVPPIAPVWAARSGTTVLEALARLTRRPPIMARVQIEFITQGVEPVAEKASVELGWMPMKLDEGIQRYLEQRAKFN